MTLDVTLLVQYRVDELMGKYWCVNQSVLAGALVSSLGWTMTFQLLIIPAVIAAVLWFFVTPDKPLIKDESRHIK